MSEDEKQLTVRMSKKLHTDLKVLCAQEGAVINNAAVEAIEEWIAKRKAKRAETASEEASHP